MMTNVFLITLCILYLTILIEKSVGLKCYQCFGNDPTKPFQCNEDLNFHDIDIEPESCTHVHDAKFCVKQYGRFEGDTLKCYQCSAADTIDCSDGMIHMATGLQPKICDTVFEAAYCIKSSSLDGGIGVKRFCSSLDLGNYCNEVQQPGDSLVYRTCMYTCTGDGCNSSRQNSIPEITTTLLAIIHSILLVIY